MNGFERRKEKKKGLIRQASLELFREHGFKKVSVNDIAHRAGVSQVTIYNHFGSKDELVREVVKSLFLSQLEKYQAIIKGDQGFLEKLETIVFEKQETVGQYQGEIIKAVLSGDPELRRFVESIWQNEVNQLIIDLFDEGKRDGFIKPELSQEAILVYMQIIRQGLFSVAALVENNPRLMRELINLITYGLNG